MNFTKETLHHAQTINHKLVHKDHFSYTCTNEGHAIKLLNIRINHTLLPFSINFLIITEQPITASKPGYMLKVPHSRIVK